MAGLNGFTKSFKAALSILGVFVLIATQATLVQASVQYTSKQLLIKNYEEIKALTDKALRQKYEIDSEEDQEKERFLQALKIPLGVTDTNSHVITILFTEIRNSLINTDLESDVLNELVDESLGALKSNSAKSAEMFTYVTILENLMTELRTDVEKYEPIFKKIRDAKIEFNESLKNYIALNVKTRGNAITPSQIAEEDLKNSEKKTQSTTTKH